MFFLSCSSYHIVIKKTKYGNKQDIPKERLRPDFADVQHTDLSLFNFYPYV